MSPDDKKPMKEMKLVMVAGETQSETFGCPYCKRAGYLAAIQNKTRAHTRRIVFFHEHNRNTHCVAVKDGDR